MKTETIEYKDGDVTLRGYLAYDETKTGKRPGILVMPEALGLGQACQGTRRAPRAARVCRPRRRSLRQRARARRPCRRRSSSRPDLFADTAKARMRVRVALDKLASLPQVDPARLAEIGFLYGRHLRPRARTRWCAAQRCGHLPFGIADPASGGAGEGKGEDPRQHRRRRSNGARSRRSRPSRKR